jgi:hypothetical protein
MLSEIVRYAFPYAAQPETFCSRSAQNCRAANKNIIGRRCDSDLEKKACRAKRPGSILVIWRSGIFDGFITRELSLSLYLVKSLPAKSNQEAVQSTISIVRQHFSMYRDVLQPEILDPKKTPLLLPPRNFEARETAELLRSLHDHQVRDRSSIQEFRSRWYNINYRHPKGGRPGGFVDQREIGFSKDPQYHNRSLKNVSSSIKESVDLLDAFYRLGCPIEIGFHFDVCRPRKAKPRPLDANFWNRATGQMEMRREHHLNISPDDAIRG